jgi:hypothetical protein
MRKKLGRKHASQRSAASKGQNLQEIARSPVGLAAHRNAESQTAQNGR